MSKRTDVTTTTTSTTTTTTSALYKKPCKYIGSVAVPKRQTEERQKFIRDKFEEMKDVVKGIPVVVMVTEEGIKVRKMTYESSVLTP